MNKKIKFWEKLNNKLTVFTENNPSIFMFLLILIANIVFIAMGDAVAIIIGQRLGAGEMERAKDEDNKIIAFAIFTSIVIGAALFFTSGLFPKLYNTSELSRTIATGFIMVQACAMAKDAFLHSYYVVFLSLNHYWSISNYFHKMYT